MFPFVLQVGLPLLVHFSGLEGVVEGDVSSGNMSAHCCSSQDLFNLDLPDPWDTHVYQVVHPALLQGDLLYQDP